MLPEIQTYAALIDVYAELVKECDTLEKTMHAAKLAAVLSRPKKTSQPKALAQDVTYLAAEEAWQTKVRERKHFWNRLELAKMEAWYAIRSQGNG